MKETLRNLGTYLIQKIAVLNRNYDRTIEPRKFYTGLGVSMGPFIVMDIIALISGSKFFDICGLLWIISIVGIRIWWKEGNLQDWLPIKKKMTL